MSNCAVSFLCILVMEISHRSQIPWEKDSKGPEYFIEGWLCVPGVHFVTKMNIIVIFSVFSVKF